MPGIGAIGPITGLPGLPSPAVGVPSGGGFLGGIGEAAGAFGQGLQQGEQLQEQRRQNAMARLQILQQQVSADPNIAKNPQWQNQAKALFKAAGVVAPLNPDQTINVNAMSPKTKLAEAFAKDPNLLTEAQQMDPTSRKAVFGAGAYDTTGIDPNFWTQPAHYFLSAGERTYIQRGLNDDLRGMAQGNLTVPQFLSWVNTNKDNMTLLGMNPDAILNANPDILGKLSATTQAKINEMEDLGILRRDQAQKALMEINSIQSLDDLRKIQGKYYQARADAIPQQLALRQYQVQNQIRQRDEALAQGEARLQNAMSNTDLRGLGLRLQAANQLRNSVESEQRDYNTLLGIAQRYTAVGGVGSVPQSVIDQLKQIKPRLDADRAMIDGARNIQGNVSGINTPKITGSTSVGPITTDSAWNAIKNMDPAAARKQVLSSKKLTKTQKADLLKRINTQPGFGNL